MNTTNDTPMHTPGPWIASRGSRRSDVIDYIKVGTGFLAFTRGIGQTNQEVTACTRLAAESPALLSALESLVGQVEQQAIYHRDVIHPNNTLTRALEDARALLARVKGGAQ